MQREAEERRSKEISDIQHELRELPGAWESVSTRRGLRIFCASSAQLLSYDLNITPNTRQSLSTAR